MDARTRVLTALAGGTPDRIPCAMGFYAIDLADRFPPGTPAPGEVDATFVHFATTPAEDAWRSMARHSPDDTRLGTFAQMANYQQWSYQPQELARRNPLARAQSLDELERFPFPHLEVAERTENLSREVQACHAQDLAVGCSLPHLGGELFEAAWRLRGLENFLLDLVERPAWAHLLLDRLTDMACRYARAVAEAGVDIMALGDDVGMPGTMMISPDCWRTFFKPRMAEIIRAARAINPDMKVVFHSDGYFTPILRDLVDIGVNGINPLQADWMDAAAIRAEFGPALAFWGTVGSQTTFSFASPDAIRREVKHRIDTLGPAGLVLSPAYDIDEPDIPWQNLAAFIAAVHAYGGQSG